MFLPKKRVRRTKNTEHGVKFVIYNFLFLLFLVVLLTSHLSLLTSNTFAAEPRPRPIPFPCDEVSPNLPLRLDDEHHSLRPYQSSPCNPNLEDTALFCANDIILGDSITVNRDQALNCTPIQPPGGGPPTTEICTFEVDRSRSFAIDLSGADLPIMGYTEPSKGNEGRFEQVVNSNVQPDPETVDDAEKVNEYVSWYLNGVNERAEYPFLDVEKNCIGETTRKPGVCKPTIPVVGTCLKSVFPPIPTLLQSDGKSSCVGATVECCVSPSPFVDPVDILDRDKLINYSGPIKKLLSQSSQWRIRIDEIDDAYASRKGDAGIRHDQVAGCTYDIFGIGNFIGPCYHKEFLGFIKTDLALDLLGVRKHRRLSEWHPENENKLPPLEEDSPDFIAYLVAIRRWRGDACTVFEVPEQVLGVPVPIIGGQQYFFCWDSPLPQDVNFWSNLFPYIPFSSTENRLGNVEVETSSLRAVSPDVVLSNISIISEPADLFFAHMQEASELADILQGTYVSKGEARVGPITSVSPSDLPFCDLAQIRSNPGDDLFAGEIGVDLSYTATFDCEFDIPPQPIEESQLCNTGLYGNSCVPEDWSCLIDSGLGPPLCPDNYRCGAECSSPPAPTCTKNLNLALGLNSNTPLADDIWSRLVAGSSGVFKRIFPKIGPNGPLVSILDIPAATRVTYSGAGLISAGNPGSQRSGAGAELYFPHIGGIHEYFLQCIQTTLRPQGYGEACESGAAAPGTFSQCGNTMADVDAAISQAASKHGVPASLLRAIFEIEGIDFIADPANYVCTENVASAAGVMQITKSTYNIVTCENERLAKDLGTCDTLDPGKLSRCNIYDAFELAARTLLWKAGRWLYGPGNCSATGPLPADKQSIYNAACNYYGSFAPDSLTINLSQSIPAAQRRQNGDMNYCEKVFRGLMCHKYQGL